MDNGSLLVISRLYLLAIAYNFMMLAFLMVLSETFSFTLYPLLARQSHYSGLGTLTAVLFAGGSLFNMYL